MPKRSAGRAWLAFFTVLVASPGCHRGGGSDVPDALDTLPGDTADDRDIDATDLSDLSDEGGLEDTPSDTEQDTIAGDTADDTDVADLPADPDAVSDASDDLPDLADEDIAGDDPPLDAPDTTDTTVETYEEILVDSPTEGVASITGMVWRDPSLALGGDASSDGVGTVLVALFDCAAMSTLGCGSTPLLVDESAGPVDLSLPESGYPYSFTGLVAGRYWVFAALDDDGSGFAGLPWEYAPVGQGDLASHPAPDYYLFATTNLVDADVYLDVRASELSGQVFVDPFLTYAGDGLGNLVVGASDVDPTSGGAFQLLGLDTMMDVNVLDGTPESYRTVLLAPAGPLYVFAYLDDDGAGSSPASGDPATIPSLTGTLPLMGGSITVDPVLDALVP